MIKAEQELGIDPRRIIIGGFSQGGVISLLTGLCESRQPLGGILALSCYAPKRATLAQDLRERNRECPDAPLPRVFMAHGTADDLVKLQWGKDSAELIRGLGVDVEFREYSGVKHGTCDAEMLDAVMWIKKQLDAAPTGGSPSSEGTARHCPDL